MPFSKYKEKWMLPFLPEILLQVLQDDKTEPRYRCEIENALL